MTPFDIIPDTHGQSAKLDAALAGLGWKRSALGWTHPDPDRQIVFLGDFIDRGPDNRAVLKTVRELVDAGKAKAIMGNHELNALHFHTTHPDDGQPLRAHSAKNIRQHRTFLDQFPPGDPQTRDVLDWMRSLPLFLEEDGFPDQLGARQRPSWVGHHLTGFARSHLRCKRIQRPPGVATYATEGQFLDAVSDVSAYGTYLRFS